MIAADYDLDRLHKNIEEIGHQQHSGRRSGKTTAYLALLQGEVALGGKDNTYLYIAETTQIASRVASLFSKSCPPEFNVSTLRQKPTVVIINGTQRFYFAGARELNTHPTDCGGRGLDRVFVDLPDDVQRSLDQNGRLTEMFQRLLIQLSYKRGDVI